MSSPYVPPGDTMRNCVYVSTAVSFEIKKSTKCDHKIFPETNKMAFLFPSGNLARSDLIIVINYGQMVPKYRLSTEQHMIEYIILPLCSDLRNLSYSNLIF